jgi:hypothetical protein
LPTFIPVIEAKAQLRRHVAYNQSILGEPDTQMRDPSPLTELQGIAKRFPGIIACDRIDLRVYPGEI